MRYDFESFGKILEEKNLEIEKLKIENLELKEKIIHLEEKCKKAEVTKNSITIYL